MSTPVDNGVDDATSLWKAVVGRAVAAVSAPLVTVRAMGRTTPAVDAEATAATSATGAAVEVRRSARRRRTVSAYRDGERIVVQIPGWFSVAEEAEWVARMVARVGAAPKRPAGDRELASRARELSERYLDGRAKPVSVRWVPAMRTRWASCTPATGAIRLSRRLQDMPPWVRDYVLVHELAHLLEPGHGSRFWQLVQRYPRTERARGYLDGVSAAANLAIPDDLADDVTEELAG